MVRVRVSKLLGLNFDPNPNCNFAILYPARGLNRDRCIPLCRAYYVFALTSRHSATATEWITRVDYLPQCGETTTANRDDLHCK